MTRRQRSDDLTTFGAPVDPRAVPGKDDAARAKRANAPLVTDRLDYQADGAGLLGPVRKHLHVLDLASGQVRQVTTGDWHASDPVWSPGSALLAFGAATAPDADLNLSAPVYVVDVSGAAGETAEPELAALASGFGAPVAWAPDGTALLVVGATGEKGLIGHTRLLRVPLPAALRAISRRSDPAKPDTEATLSGPKTEGALLDLAGALDRNVMPGGPGYPGGMPQFTDGGDTVLFCARDRGCSHVSAVPADGSAAPRPVVTGAGRVVSGLSVAGGTAAVVLATPTSFGEVVAIDLAGGVEGVLTAHGSFNGPGTADGGTQGDVDLFVRQEREFAISDGTVVQGWLVRDPSLSGPGPVLLDVHGGPHNAWNGAADPAHRYHQELAARGWTVLILNPPASDGYGEAFYTATTGGWGTNDARVSVATARGMCAAMSPLTRVGGATTPTLVLHSVADLSYHVGQALRWFTTLREQGLSARLVPYRSLSLSDSRHRPAGGRERSSAAWPGRCSRRPVAVFRHRAVAAAKPSGDLPSLARIWRGGVQGVALIPGSIRSRRYHTCPSARLLISTCNIKISLENSIVCGSSLSDEQHRPWRVAPLHSRRRAVTSNRLQQPGGGLGGAVRKRGQAAGDRSCVSKHGALGAASRRAGRKAQGAGRVPRHPATRRRRRKHGRPAGRGHRGRVRLRQLAGEG